jgi:hypothetical protein
MNARVRPSVRNGILRKIPTRSTSKRKVFVRWLEVPCAFTLPSVMYKANLNGEKRN